MRFDLRPGLLGTGTSGQGVAYVTDSSTEGRNGLIVVDLATGASWRRVGATAAVRPDPGFVGWVSGHSVYSYDATSSEATYLPTGSDGIALSADGADLYFGSLGSRRLYSVPTALLRDEGGAAGASGELRAQQGTVYRGEKGFSDGFETDSNGIVYMGNFEQNAVVAYDPKNGTVGTFVRDPRINWVDTRESCQICTFATTCAISRTLGSCALTDLCLSSFDVHRWLSLLYEQSASLDWRNVSRNGQEGETLCFIQGQVA